MGYLKLIPAIYLKNGVAVDKIDGNTPCMNGDAIEIANTYANNGADEILIIDISETDAEHERTVRTIISIADAVDIPMLVGGCVDTLEDVKKYVCTGAKKVILDACKESNLKMLSVASDRFGSDKIAVLVDERFDFDNIKNLKYDGASLVIANNCAEKVIGNGIKVLAYNGTDSFDDIVNFADNEKIYGVSHKVFNPEFDYMNFKHQLKDEGVKVFIFESKIPFSQFKLNSDGLIPVVVQDYKTNKVLMVAYMNEESYNLTIKTSKMTYYSRSRNEIWVKGMTSGHYQYVKELTIDCDMDTILAKVYQVGVPCHTGAETCFFNELVKTDYNDDNPEKVFDEIYKLIQSRKTTPKEGSYTNYLFEKGLDKILKKLGEDATEIIIAAKNTDSQEVKYEISEFLFHIMVLMVEKGISWKDIMKELSRR